MRFLQRVLTIMVVTILIEIIFVRQVLAINCCAFPNIPINGSQCTDPNTNVLSNNNCSGGTCEIVSNLCLSAPTTIAPGGLTLAPTNSPWEPCKNDATGKCAGCIANNQTWTAIGCLENEPAALVGHLIGIGGGIAGGIAFLLMLWGAAQLVLSQGVPEKIQAAKDTITSAVIGVVFIFLSVLILKLIGVQILGIPGWS